MHIYFVGIGGTGIGPLALIAHEAGYEVSGSDDKPSEYTKYLQNKGIELTLDQSGKYIAERHAVKPIDWIVSVSAIVRNNPNHPELLFGKANNIRLTERDECLNEILHSKNLKMIAAAGTHGKTTSTAMLLWLFQGLEVPVSYSLGAKTSFAEMGHYEPGSEYFLYECDEFHRNFLNFYPYESIISGIAWDHHEVFPTPENYNEAFREFFGQSQHTYLWDSDAAYVQVESSDAITVVDSSEQWVDKIRIPGHYNRRNAWLAICAVHRLTGADVDQLVERMSLFPGTQRRMEEIIPNLYSDYAHTPEKITGCMSVAKEIADDRQKSVVVVYEPLTNRRQHFMKNDYRNCFDGAKHVYWIPSYLSREDPNQPVLTPEELIDELDDPSIASPAQLDEKLWETIATEIQNSSIVVCMSGGGGGSLDEWLRAKALTQNL